MTNDNLDEKRHQSLNDEIEKLSEKMNEAQKKQHLNNGIYTRALNINHFIPAFEKIHAFIVTNNGDLYLYDYDQNIYRNDNRVLYKLFRETTSIVPTSHQIDTIRNALIESDYAIEETKLNSNFIPVKNGIVNRKTKEFIENDITLFVKNRLNITYNRDVKYPEKIYDIDQFILDTANQNEERYYGLMQVINYALSGINPHHNIVMFLGEGGSGKSAINKLITSLVGDKQVASINLSQFNQDQYLTGLIDKFVCIGDDLSDGQYIGDLENLKTLSAGGPIDINIKYRKDNYHLIFDKMIIQNAARIPKFSESGEQLKRRLKVYNFENRFTGSRRKMSNDEFNEMINNEDVKSYLLNQLLNIDINDALNGSDDELLEEVTSINDEYKTFIDSIQYTKLMTLDFIPNSVMRAIYLDMNNQDMRYKSAISSGKLISMLKPYMEKLGYVQSREKARRPKFCIKNVAIFDDINNNINETHEMLFEDYEENGYGFDIKDGNYPNYEKVMSKNAPSQCWVKKEGDE